jgi:oligogalacturonide transport system permease protein
MSRKQLRALAHFLHYVLLTALGLVLIFPLVYMFFATFKTSNEIFASMDLFPRQFSLDGYINGWKGVGQTGFMTFILNSFYLTLPTVLFTILSSLCVAYGFSRFEFPGKKLFFSIMMALMMLPGAVLIIPRYLLFVRLDWVNSYLPFWIPSLFATSSFFIYMFVQFFRGLPVELDERGGKFLKAGDGLHDKVEQYNGGNHGQCHPEKGAQPAAAVDARRLVQVLGHVLERREE